MRESHVLASLNNWSCGYCGMLSRNTRPVSSTHNFSTAQVPPLQSSTSQSYCMNGEVHTSPSTQKCPTGLRKCAKGRSSACRCFLLKGPVGHLALGSWKLQVLAFIKLGVFFYTLYKNLYVCTYSELTQRSINSIAHNTLLKLWWCILIAWDFSNVIGQSDFGAHSYHT